MRHFWHAAVAFGLALLLPSPSKAFCLNAAADSRLQVYCLSSLLAGAATDVQSAQVLDYRMKQEGYSRGIGLPGRVERTSFSPYISPLLEYSSDINGGNPDRPLRLGSLTFFGSEEFFRKEGIVVGAGIGGSGRSFYGEGKYVDFSLGASYVHSPEHDIGITRGFATACSENDIGRNFYLDGCVNTTRIKRDLVDETTSSVGINVAKLFSINNRRFNQASVGIRKLFDEEYEQNQAVIGLNTLHAEALYTGLEVAFGEAVTDTLTMRHSISATVGTTLFNKAIRATMSYSYSDGGKLFGVARDEKTSFFKITYEVHPRVNISIGYRETKSNIDYFNESEAILGLQFAPIRF